MVDIYNKLLKILNIRELRSNKKICRDSFTHAQIPNIHCGEYVEVTESGVHINDG